MVLEEINGLLSLRFTALDQVRGGKGGLPRYF